MSRSDDLVLVHSSDLHLGCDGAPSPEQQMDDLAPLRLVIRTARAIGAHIVLLAGDVFDHNRQPLALLERVARLMAEAGLPIVILPGNHDPLTPDSVYRRGGLADPPNVHVLGVSVDEAVTFPRFDLEIWGRAHLDYGTMSPLRDPRPRSTRWQVAVAHGHFLEEAERANRFLGSWVISAEEIDATGADYLALGHWNRAARVGNGRVPAYYSGSPDWAGTVNAVRFQSDGRVEVRRQPVLVSESLAGEKTA